MESLKRLTCKQSAAFHSPDQDFITISDHPFDQRKCTQRNTEHLIDDREKAETEIVHLI